MSFSKCTTMMFPNSNFSNRYMVFLLFPLALIMSIFSNCSMYYFSLSHITNEFESHQQQRQQLAMLEESFGVIASESNDDENEYGRKKFPSVRLTEKDYAKAAQAQKRRKKQSSTKLNTFLSHKETEKRYNDDDTNSAAVSRQLPQTYQKQLPSKYQQKLSRQEEDKDEEEEFQSQSELLQQQQQQAYALIRQRQQQRNIQKAQQQRRRQQKRQQGWEKPKKKSPRDLNPKAVSEDVTFSACLLIRDDNELLNEWIAYHYHVLKLRYLIVAVDPLSETSPKSILDKWGNYTDMTIKQWDDESYMPEYFIENGRAPDQYLLEQHKLNKDKGNENENNNNNNIDNNSNNNGNNETTTTMTQSQSNEEDANTQNDDEANTDTDKANAEQNAALLEISNHRYRQRIFLNQCIKTLKQEKRTWMIHIDTDEFVVVNKVLRNLGQQKQQQEDNIPKYFSKHHIIPNITAPEPIQSGSYLSILKEALLHNSSHLGYPCVTMLRVLYGSKEDKEQRNDDHDHDDDETSSSSLSIIPKHFNETSFETLRWKYHASMHREVNDGSSNGGSGVAAVSKPSGFSKVILDVSRVPLKLLYDDVVHSIHRPVSKLCRRFVEHNFDRYRKFPLSVNHYLGSWERYNGRKNDKRRNYQTYIRKAAGASKEMDDYNSSTANGAWLKSFVHNVGLYNASILLGPEYLKSSESSYQSLESEPQSLYQLQQE